MVESYDFHVVDGGEAISCESSYPFRIWKLFFLLSGNILLVIAISFIPLYIYC